MHVLEPQEAREPSHLTVANCGVQLFGGDPDLLMVFDDEAGLQSGWYGYLNHLRSHCDSG